MYALDSEIYFLYEPLQIRVIQKKKISSLHVGGRSYEKCFQKVFVKARQ